MFARPQQLGHSKRFAQPAATLAIAAAPPLEDGLISADARNASRTMSGGGRRGFSGLLGALGVGLVASLCWVTPAAAADETSDADTSADEKSDDKKEGEDANEGADKETDGAAEAAAEAARAKAEADSTPVEKRGETYYFVGARYRLVVVPAFMMHLFADGGTTVPVHSGGAEFGIRKDNFEYNLGLWLASYAMDPTKFKSKTDADDAWELVESKLKVLYLTADFMWSQPVAKEFAINYGMGAGLGIVFGDLLRTQAYPDPNGPGGYSP
ncbi:MAG TPA: hypothetical protein VFQ61_14360, partial [Polyangiaceae bacterium]|nr:hypothetical protein [Polyangiaceae bacterium]